MQTPLVNRRTFVVSAAASAAAVPVVRAQGTPDAPGRGLRVAVLEYADRWTTESVGAGEFMRRAGATVQPLDLSLAPLVQPGPVDAIVFGSFTNNDRAYLDYVKQHTPGIREFVERGGVVLEMTQSDQFGPRVDYLPSGMTAERGDRDLTDVYTIAAGHPLLERWLPTDRPKVDASYLARKTPNWESFESWAGLRVLAASAENGSTPCLLEGAHGRGRFVLSSLWIDKCFAADGRPTQPDDAVRIGQLFFDSFLYYVRLVKSGSAPMVTPSAPPAASGTGPMLGHIDTTRARLWYRPAPSQHDLVSWTCSVTAAGAKVTPARAALDPDHDFTLHFELRGLRPGTVYKYEITPDPADTASTAPITGTFTTPPANDAPARVTLGLGSCAPSDPSSVWTRIIDEGCQGFVWLGDTPYIDSSDLAVAREKHRRFLSQPEIARMIAGIPCWGTWDDHDFGLNDGHGDFPGKHVCRLAFTEYRANATFGHDQSLQPQGDPHGTGRGIYTSFRFGPVELFLLDPRWFSRTERSWADPTKQTCLGRVQWEWLQRGLRDSTATFKALTTGMIWDDKTNSERDDWHTYAHERDAIFDFIRDQRIPGCFLIGGDIHVSRALNYGPRVGYELWQFIISPLHGSTIPSLDVPHPALVHHAVEPHVFLKLTADTTVTPATLTATWINRDGRRIFEVTTDADRLRA